MDAVSRLKKITSGAGSSSKNEEVEEVQENTIIQLPMWPEPTRGLPNTIARSSLFNVRFKKTPRVQLKNHVVSALNGINILYTGEELRQDDETILLQLLHLAQSQPLGEPIQFTPYSFLKKIKWTTSGQNQYKRLSECIDRLAGNLVKVTCEKQNIAYKSSLVRKIYNTDDGSGNFVREWTVWLEPEIIKLFSSDSYSRIHWEQRLSLRKPVAQWLHSFYTGHERPFPMKVSTLMTLSDTAAKTLSSFRTALRRSLDDLVSLGFLENYFIDPDTDLVNVKKAAESGVVKQF